MFQYNCEPTHGVKSLVSSDGFVLVHKGFFEIALPVDALATLSPFEYVCVLGDIMRVAMQPENEIRTVRNVIVHDAKHVTMTVDLVGWVSTYKFDPEDVQLLN